MGMPTSPILTTILLFSCLLLTLGFNTDPKCASSDQGSTLKVMHIYDKCSPFRPAKALSWEETVLDTAAKDDARVLYLSNLVAGKSSLPIASGRQITQSATYVVQAKIGTPPQTMYMSIDTSSDAAWIPCTDCVGCSSKVFAPAKSTTFAPTSCERAVCAQVPARDCDAAVCTFNQTYGSATFAAKLSEDTLTLANDSIPSYYYGCLSKVAGGSVPAQGMLGLGRGMLSLMYQAQKLYKSTFSYCLPNFKSTNFSGSLRLGPTGQPTILKTTPLLRNPRRSSLYYVDLQGIRVGPRLAPIPSSALTFNPITGAGTIFDSGTVFTRLVAPAYTAFRDEFRKRVKPKGAVVSALGGFDTCYTVPITPPSISFQFKGMNMTLPADNVLIHSTAGSITCLAMAAAPDNVNSVVNVIASMQQQNHRILFDVSKSRLGVSRERCT